MAMAIDFLNMSSAREYFMHSVILLALFFLWISGSRRAKRLDYSMAAKIMVARATFFIFMYG